MGKQLDLIKLHEGFRPYAYKDSLGYLTIGYGFLIDQAKGGAMPRPVADFWLDYELNEKDKELRAALPWVSSLDEVRHYVLLDMAYNLGIGGLLQFAQTLASVKNGEYHKAAGQMLQSKWAGQVGTRATRLAKMMESGSWPAL